MKVVVLKVLLKVVVKKLLALQLFRTERHPSVLKPVVLSSTLSLFLTNSGSFPDVVKDGFMIPDLNSDVCRNVMDFRIAVILSVH